MLASTCGQAADLRADASIRPYNLPGVGFLRYRLFVGGGVLDAPPCRQGMTGSSVRPNK